MERVSSARPGRTGAMALLRPWGWPSARPTYLASSILFLAALAVIIAVSAPIGTLGRSLSSILTPPSLAVPTAQPTSPAPRVLPSSVPPPAATTAFLEAYLRGDETTADRLASTLYRLEWARRDLSAEERERSSRPSGTTDGERGTRLTFAYVGGVDDGRFRRLLYTARPTSRQAPELAGGGSISHSVWRVDTTLDGRVIWLEMVWLFDAGSGAPRPVLDPDELALAPVPSTPCCIRPLFGVASGDGREAYYALALGATNLESPARSEPAVVRFYAADSDGAIRPGAWTYGQDSDELLHYGRGRPKTRKVDVPTEQVPLLEEYLLSLD